MRYVPRFDPPSPAGRLTSLQSGQLDNQPNARDRAFILGMIANPKSKPLNGLTPVSWVPLAAAPTFREMIADGTLIVVRHETREIHYFLEKP